MTEKQNSISATDPTYRSLHFQDYAMARLRKGGGHRNASCADVTRDGTHLNVPDLFMNGDTLLRRTMEMPIIESPYLRPAAVEDKT